MSGSCCSCGGSSSATSGENGSRYPYGQDSGNVTGWYHWYVDWGGYFWEWGFALVVVGNLRKGCSGFHRFCRYFWPKVKIKANSSEI